MQHSVRVEKIGGDDSFRMKSTLSLLRSRTGEKGVYVFSAFKNSIRGQEFNTTARLIGMGEKVSLGDYDGAFEELSALRGFYLSVIEREFARDTDALCDLAGYCWQEFYRLSLMLGRHRQIHQNPQSHTSSFDLPNPQNDYAFLFEGRKISLLGFGEILTTKLFHRAALRESAYLDTSNVPFFVKPFEKSDPIADIYQKVAGRAHELLQRSDMVFVPGYVGFLPGGILDAFGRGYSDATASRAYQSLAEANSDNRYSFAIKKLFAICSADPRIVGEDSVRTLRQISLRLLLEMVGARGAGGPFVNRNAINRKMFQNDGSLRLYTDSDAEGSVITNAGDRESSGVLFVQSKPVWIVSITSFSMHRDGYVEKVGDFFGRRAISIGNLVSSETAISLTVNEKELDAAKLPALLADLRSDLATLEEPGNEAALEVGVEPIAEIHVGGERIDSPGLLGRIGNALNEKGISIVTGMQTMHPRAIVLGVPRENEAEAVRILHAELVK